MKKIVSKYNGIIEVATEDGELVLNSEHTNYSGRTLHDIFIKVMAHVDFTNVGNILLLGLGGGTVVRLLQNECGYTKNLVAVELDPVIVDVARHDFGIQDSSKLSVICSDATIYVKSVRRKFDVIICDIFVDNKMPDSIASTDFWADAIKRLSPNGTIVFNGFMENDKLKHVSAFLRENDFKVKFLSKVCGSNSFLIARHIV